MKIRAIACWLLTAATGMAAPSLDGPYPILVGDAPLDVEHVGQAAPYFGDIDGDGTNDLLVGEFYKGRLRVYRNTGTNQEPTFDGFTVFQEGESDGCVMSS